MYNITLKRSLKVLFNDKICLVIEIKMIHCLSYDVYKNNMDMDFLYKVEVNKQYRQSVMKRENADFSKL